MASEAGVEPTVARADEEIVGQPVSTRTVFRWAAAAGPGLLTVWLAWRAAVLMADVFVQIVIAVFIAVSLDPAVRWMVRHKVSRAQAVLVIVLTSYLMLDLPRLRRAPVRLFPKRHRRSVNDVVNVVVDKVGSYMIGNLIVSAFAGAATLAALLALRVPFALPLALWVAVTDLIPMIGATLGAVVCVIVAFATGSLWPTTILVVVFFVVYQQVENYLIVPRVMRNTVSLPLLAVLVAAPLGGAVLGLVGALMAIPVAAAIGAIVTPVRRARDEEPAQDARPDEPMIAPDA